MVAKHWPQNQLPCRIVQTMKLFFFFVTVWFQSRLVLPTCVCCDTTSVSIVDDGGTAMTVRMAAKRSFAAINNNNNNNNVVVVVLFFTVFVLHSGELFEHTFFTPPLPSSHHPNSPTSRNSKLFHNDIERSF